MMEKVELPIDEIIEKYESGVSQARLAKEYNVSNGFIFKRISEYYQKTGKEKPRRVYAKKELPGREIVKEYEAGISQAKLARKYNVSDFTIRMRMSQYCQETGREKPKGLCTKKDLPIEEIVIKYESGMLQSQLAKEYNVSSATISTRISEYYQKTGRKKTPKTYHRKKLPMEEIIKKYESGISQAQLAEEYNMSQSVIGIRISEYYYETGREKPERKKLEKKEEVNTEPHTQEEGKKPKELRSTTIIIDYLKKGLSIEEIIETASKRNIVIPQKLIDDALNKANVKNIIDDNEGIR